jgi:EAL domain-containing protein (putative c-di-GMP-specific phosphodiesterase class I)
MELAFVGETRDGSEVIRWSSGDTESFGVEPGGRFLTNGEAPGKGGTVIGVPVTLSDGRVYGTFHCASHEARGELKHEDLKALQVLAHMTARQIERSRLESVELTRRCATIHRVLEAVRSMRIVFQPIVDLSNGAVVGAEALARFSARPLRRPDVWIAEARAVDLATTVEIAALRMALGQLDELPDSTFLSVNVSCETMMSPELLPILKGIRSSRVVLEVVEAPFPDDTECLHEAIEIFQADGFRVAIDDAGSGLSDLRRIKEIEPDVIKLDMSLTHHVDRDPVRYAWLGAMASFVSRTPAMLVAEGIESPGELKRVRDLGVPFGQGNLLAAPGNLPLPLWVDLDR